MKYLAKVFGLFIFCIYSKNLNFKVIQFNILRYYVKLLKED